MPWPNSPSSTGEPRGTGNNSDWKRRNTPIKEAPIESEASKELNRLATYLRENFTKQAATKEKTVDVVIDLLNEFKSQKDAMKEMFEGGKLESSREVIMPEGTLKNFNRRQI